MHQKKPAPLSDLDEIVDQARDDFEALRGCRIFVTGGTGFVGTWLLESLLRANQRLSLATRVVVLTRDPERFAESTPHIAGDSAIESIAGDVNELPTISGTLDAIVHAATPASQEVNDKTPLLMVDTILKGGRNALELARRFESIPFLFTSSGAVYGRQSEDFVSEEAMTGPDPLNPAYAYHEAKRLSELECAVFARDYGIRAKIARLFAFLGPHLPIDRHFAAGNFIRDALSSSEILVRGDGATVRSYLYPTDMCVWLWRILIRGETARAYNVGSARPVTIRELATAAAGLSERGIAARVLGIPDPCKPIDRYVPSVTRATSELELRESIALEEGIRRTLCWHRTS